MCGGGYGPPSDASQGLNCKGDAHGCVAIDGEGHWDESLNRAGADARHRACERHRVTTAELAPAFDVIGLMVSLRPLASTITSRVLASPGSTRRTAPAKLARSPTGAL